MEKYQQYTDEELIEAIRRDEPEAIDYIMVKYKELVKRKARPLYLMGGDKDDLIQEGMIGLFKAVRDYQKSKGMSFHSFAAMCISRQMYTAVEASNRKKHSPLNTYISLYSGSLESDHDSIPLQDILPAATGANPEDVVIYQENVKRIEKEVNERLSSYEQTVLNQYLAGADYIEIAKTMDKSPKSIDNALQRIRKKLSSNILSKKD